MTNKKKEKAEQQNYLKEFFESIRDENEGKITKEKLKSVAQELGFQFTEAELQDMIQVADPGGEGAVSYKGLAKMVHKSHDDFPRLKTSIEEIRRELTTLSIAPNKEEPDITMASDQQEDKESISQSVDSITEPTPSTSKSESLEQGQNTNNINENGVHDGVGKEIEADNVVVIGKVMKACENDNKKVSSTTKGKGTKTKSTPALVIPVSDETEGRGSVMDDKESVAGDNDRSSKDGKDLNIAVIPKVEPVSEKKQAINDKEKVITHSQPEDGGMPNGDTNNSERPACENDRNDVSQEVDTQNVDSNWDVQSRQSATTRFSLDAGVVTAVDAYGNSREKTRGRKKLYKQEEEEELNEEDELQTLQETPDMEEDSVTSRDSKAYIRDKTRRVRRKASLTQSQEDMRKPTVKPVVRKRSLTRSKQPRSKGPTKPNDKHSVFYSGLGCALKISQLRTKQRLLYQMWQLVYDEAMMRLQQTFHYDYARDPAPIMKEKVQPKKRLKKRNSSSDYD